MGVPSSVKVRIAAIVLTLIPIYYISFALHAHSRSHSLLPNFIHADKHLATREFVAEALQHQVSDPFNISTLSNLCQTRQPRPDVIIACQPGTGGVGNIRSYMLHCTRFAIEAGASLILPRFHRRTRSDLFELIGEIALFEHFFDREHFIETLETACPHMKVYTYMQPNWTIANMEIPHWPHAINVSTMDRPSPWRQEFNKWFVDATSNLPAAPPHVFASGDPGRDRAVMDDGVELYYTIGRVLQFRPDARRLAALCIAEISRRFKLHLDPTTPIFMNAYMGAHLRTSSDAVKAGWNPNFEEQTDWYLNQTLQHNLTVIYAAGGNDADLALFAQKAANYSIHLVTKNNLLEGNDARELKNMLWDQRGLVDFEVLLRATQYGGYARSSFSHNVAFRRHFGSVVKDPFGSVNDHFRDERSVVYGRFDAAWEDEGVRTMWP